MPGFLSLSLPLPSSLSLQLVKRKLASSGPSVWTETKINDRPFVRIADDKHDATRSVGRNEGCRFIKRVQATRRRVYLQNRLSIFPALLLPPPYPIEMRVDRTVGWIATNGKLIQATAKRNRRSPSRFAPSRGRNC